MTKENLNGGVILMKGSKELVQTKKIRIYQREKLADKLNFLVPMIYDNFDLSKFTVTLLYVGQDGTVHSEQLNRLSDGQGGYIDYEDAYGNFTHMIFQLDVDTNITLFAGDLTLRLNLQYTDYEGASSSNNDNEEAPDPVGITHVISTDDTILTILPVADYYSVVPDTSLSYITQTLEKIDSEQKKLEAAADVYNRTKADSLELHIDPYCQCLRLTSNGRPIGNEIDLNTLGDAITEWQESGLIKVITDEDEPEPTPTPTDEYADNIVLVVDESTHAIYLTSKGKKIGTPIDLEDLGVAISDITEEGLIKVVTDDDNSVITGD